MLIQTVDSLSLWQQVGFKPHASRQELIAVLADVAEFLKSGKGDQKRGDQVYAQEQLAHVARNRFDDACEEIATRRGWRQYSQKTYQAVAARIWEAKLPSGKDSFHFKFYTDWKKQTYAWRGMSLIELPSVSKHRGFGGQVFLAIETLDLMRGDLDPRYAKVGERNQQTLITSHAIDRYAERVAGDKYMSRSKALAAFVRMLLTAQGKALLLSREGRAYYVVKTESGCLYLPGFSGVEDNTCFHFFKTLLIEHSCRPQQRRWLEALRATSSRWQDVEIDDGEWRRVPFAAPPPERARSLEFGAGGRRA